MQHFSQFAAHDERKKSSFYNLLSRKTLIENFCVYTQFLSIKKNVFS